MPITLSPAQTKLLHDKNLAFVATNGPDGSSQVTPVWVDYDGTHVLINSEKTRAKVRNLERDPRVSLAVADAADPYKYVEIRGTVVAITPDGAFEHIDKLAKKYRDVDKYPWNKPEDVRVIVKIAPEKVLGMK